MKHIFGLGFGAILAVMMAVAVTPSFAGGPDTPGKSNQADPKGEPRAMGFGDKSAGQSADKVRTNDGGYVGNADIVGAKG